jgi:curli production assembly/transport component CsgG
MLKIVTTVLLALSLVGCANTLSKVSPPSTAITPVTKGLKDFPKIGNGKPVVVAVYNFLDKTGQRKPADTFSNISTAVTQGAEIYLIKALDDLADGGFFDVVERGGMESLVKERQIIRQAREKFDPDKGLGPLKFAGVIIEGGVVGYDTNKYTGGIGARIMGIGPQSQWRVDVVTVGIRAVSVLTGEVLLAVSAEKTIISTATAINVFKFYDLGTKVLEIEAGTSTNEPVNYAVRQAIEYGVVQMVKEGKRKGYWNFDSTKIPDKFIEKEDSLEITKVN